MIFFKFTLICMSLILAVEAARTRKTLGLKSAVTSRMVGGEPIDVNTVPFIVSIKNVPFDYHKCAGFIVSDRHVVTTATCLYPATRGQAQAYLRPSTLDNLDKGYVISNWVIHQNYSVLPLQNDIAVATLSEPIANLKTGQILSLSKWSNLPMSAEVLTYGWGYSKIDRDRYGNFTIHSKSLKIMPNAMCSLLLHEYLSCSKICATSDNQFASAPADVGTPLVYKDGNEMFAVGMLISPTEKLVSAATFASVYEYRDFIQEVIKASTTGLPGASTTTTTTPTTTISSSTAEVTSTATDATTDDDESEEDEDEDNPESEDDESERGRRRKNSRRHLRNKSRSGKHY